MANGQSVWRLTPDPDSGPVALDQMQVKANPLTFKLGDKTLTMPGGKVFVPEKPLSTAGCWIVGPDDLQPVVAP